jgi:hypothetical protein
MDIFGSNFEIEIGKFVSSLPTGVLFCWIKTCPEISKSDLETIKQIVGSYNRSDEVVEFNESTYYVFDWNARTQSLKATIKGVPVENRISNIRNTWYSILYHWINVFDSSLIAEVKITPGTQLYIPLVAEQDSNITTDQTTAFWLKNYPYQIQSPPFQRRYLDLDAIPKRYKTHNLFQQSKKDMDKTQLYYANGRQFYYIENRTEEIMSPLLVTLPLYSTPNTRLLQSRTFMKLFRLICTGFKVNDILTFFGQEDGNCSEYGSKIAKSLVKVASTRIFAEPEQSIIELPVNSIDSYNSEAQIGKFGMGFFSILYWLVDHPKRTLDIESYHQNSLFTCQLKEQEGELKFTLQYGETNVQSTGTVITLNCEEDHFTPHNVEMFEFHLKRLTHISSDLLVFRRSENEVFKKLNAADVNHSNKVYIQLNRNGIMVQDFAKGMSLEVLLKKLFVPSVSTKTIQSSVVENEVLRTAKSTITQTSTSTNVLVLLVRSVAVVYIPFSTSLPEKFEIVIDLPGNTRIPVSRDDIILNVETKIQVEREILQILRYSIDILRNVYVLQSALRAYITYSTQVENKNFFRTVLQQLPMQDKVRVNVLYFQFLQQLDTGMDVLIASETSDLQALGNFLSSKPSDRTVYWGKKVILLNDVPNIVSTTELIDYLFVDVDFVNNNAENKQWVVLASLLFTSDKLYILKDEITEGTIEEVFTTQIIESLKLIQVPPTPIVYNWLTQLVLKLLAFFDIYGFDSIYDIDPNVIGNNRVLRNWDGPCGFHTENKVEFVLCIIRQLVFLCAFSNEFALSYFNQFHRKLNSYLEGKKHECYGSKRILFKLVTNQFQSQVLPVNNVTFLGEETLSVLLQAFPKLFQFSTDWSAFTIQLKSINNPKIFFWTCLNPVFIVKRYGKKGVGVRDHILYFLVQNMSQFSLFEFMAIYLFISNELADRFYIETHYFYSDAKTKQTESYLYSVLLFTLQFVKDHIFDYELFFTTCLNLNNFLETVLVTKYKISTDCFLSTRTNRTILLPLLDNELPVVDNRLHFTESQLIDYVLKNDFDETTLFEGANNKNPSDPIQLQITEIAINEGSTKSFINAVLTETIQNSLDAVRVFKPSNESIEVFLKENETHVVYQITDYIGINFKGILSLMIPFLSSKAASPTVTGEMGSGFFNAYRESCEVIIYTTLNGKSTLIKDIPVRDGQNRVVDINRCVEVKSDTRGNQTDIFVKMLKSEFGDRIHYTVHSFVYFIKNVFSLLPLDNLIYNGQAIKVETEELISTPKFQSRFICKQKLESYIFTKGVPFLPLKDFVVNAALLPEYIIPFLSYKLIVDIQHGVYTPVQTRAKINMSPENRNAFTQFLTNSLYECILKTIVEESDDGNTLLYNNWNQYLNNFASSAPLSQLLPYQRDDVDVWNAEMILHFMMYYKVASHENFASLILKSYAIMGDQEFALLTHDQKTQIKQLSSWGLQSQVLLFWLSNKNVTETVVYATVAMPLITPEQEAQVLTIFRTFTEKYWEGGASLKIQGFEKKCPTVNIKLLAVGMIGFYTSDDHSININKTHLSVIDIDEFLNWFTNIRKPNQLQLLDNNSYYDNYLKYNTHARTLVHELEHARRSISEGLKGCHDYKTFKFPNDKVEKLYSFDEAANNVYRLILLNPGMGFWERVLEV